MTHFTRRLVPGLLLVGALSAAALPRADEAMHLRLTKSIPAKDTVLTTAPAAVQLWYSEVPQLRLSSVTLTGPNGAVELGKVTADSIDAKLLVAPVIGSMGPGSYSIAWRTASSDGHAIRGTIPFTIRRGE